MSTNQDKNFFLNLFDSPSPNNTEINQKEPVKMINENSVLSTIVTLIIIMLLIITILILILILIIIII